MRDRKPGKPGKSGRSGRQNPNPITPLDAEKRRLQEEASRLQAEMERKRRLIEEAPRLKAEAEKRRREELVVRASRTEARLGSPGALLDPRHGYEANVGGAVVRTRKFRQHRIVKKLGHFLGGRQTRMRLLAHRRVEMSALWRIVLQNSGVFRGGASV